MSDTLNFIVTSILPAIATYFGGWFFGRRKYNAEVKSSEIENFNQSIEAYKKLYEDRENVYQSQIEELKKENDDLKVEVKELRTQVATITNIVMSYTLNRSIPIPPNFDTVMTTLKSTE